MKSGQYKLNFLNYIYMNFEHELDARVNQIYEYYNFKKLSIDSAILDFEENTVYKDLLWLGNFNYNNQLIKYDKSILLEITNQFNLLYEIEQININKLQKYYENWGIIFKNNSNEYIIHCKNAIKNAILKEPLVENSFTKYIKMSDMCYFEPSLLEQLIQLDPDKEIRKLVEKFKKLTL